MFDIFSSEYKHKAKHYKKVAKEYKKKYSSSRKRYKELSEKLKKDIKKNLDNLANSEVNKDALYYTLRSQTSLINKLLASSQDIDHSSVKQDIDRINSVLEALGEEGIRFEPRIDSALFDTAEFEKREIYFT